MDSAKWIQDHVAEEIYTAAFGAGDMFTLPQDSRIMTSPPVNAFALSSSLVSSIPDWDGRVLRTVNKMGYARTYVDHFVQQYADTVKERVSTPLALDIGAGLGANSIYLALRGFAVLCTDAESRHIEYVKDIVKHLDSGGAPVQSIGFATALLPDMSDIDGTYDLITCSQVLHYLKPEDVLRSMKKIRELLRPDGVALVSLTSAWCADYRFRLKDYILSVTQGNLDAGLIDPYYIPGKLNHNPGFVYTADHNLLSRIAKAARLHMEDYVYQNLAQIAYSPETDLCSHVIVAVTPAAL